MISVDQNVYSVLFLQWSIYFSLYQNRKDTISDSVEQLVGSATSSCQINWSGKLSGKEGTLLSSWAWARRHKRDRARLATDKKNVAPLKWKKKTGKVQSNDIHSEGEWDGEEKN